jgi:hypothetical protein
VGNAALVPRTAARRKIRAIAGPGLTDISSTVSRNAGKLAITSMAERCQTDEDTDGLEATCGEPTPECDRRSAEGAAVLAVIGAADVR